MRQKTEKENVKGVVLKTKNAALPYKAKKKPEEQEVIQKPARYKAGKKSK